MMMMKEESNGWARVCDTCRSAACAVYCRADSAYLCAGCDARVHAANRVASRHERVRICEACERAPAAFLCKADAASLCASCDADIHSANPLARRHIRLPISSSAASSPQDDGDDEDDGGDDDEAASWLLLNPNRPASAAAAGGININNQGSNNNININNGFLFGGAEVDEYLDLVEYNSGGGDEKMMTTTAVMMSGGDSVVPCSGDRQGNMNMMVMMMESSSNNNNNNNNNLQSCGFQLGLDFDDHSSPKPGYSNYNDAISHSVSVSSMDVSVVPDSTMSEISMISHPRPPKGTIDLFSGPPIQVAPTQLTPLDREARVLRYREKKKNRKFEKTIRYASRKAYAETRPRIKGRFAKRTDVELEVDQIFSTSLMVDSGYGIVPSF